MTQVEKRYLREELQALREELPAEKRQAWDTAITQRLLCLSEFLEASSVMTFLSFGTEINTWPILEAVWASGKTAFVPKVLGRKQGMIAVQIESQDDLKPGVWGISEPVSEKPAPPGSLDCIVVPGLAFSASGYRLGYGGGYYDGFLSQATGAKVGICYEMFLREVPVCAWDVPVDVIVTEVGVRRIG